MAYGKSIELFLVNGSADSLITAELSNWNGKAIKIPRIDIAPHMMIGYTLNGWSVSNMASMIMTITMMIIMMSRQLKRTQWCL